jgi:hypothetical protein
MHGFGEVVRHIRTLIGRQTAAGASDHQLLHRFADTGGERR